MLNWQGAFLYLHAAELFGGHASSENPPAEDRPSTEGVSGDRDLAVRASCRCDLEQLAICLPTLWQGADDASEAGRPGWDLNA